MMQTILGSGGAIGEPLAKELTKYTNKIRLVARNPKAVNETDELFKADLTDAAQVDKAIEGSEVVYLTLGLEYNIKVWEKTWPKLMRHVIDSCKKHGATLVFFDNIYMYDKNFMGNITEETPVRPSSKKGKVRAEIAGMILDEVAAGKLKAVIARSADFYAIKNSVIVEMVIKNLEKDKKAMWFANINKVHTYTSAVDAAKGTALLGNTPDAVNQVWHLPTSRVPLTGKQWIEMISGILMKKPKYFVIPAWLLAVIGVFAPVFGEFKEMLYQYDRDYVFNSRKFEKRFNYSPVTPQEGITEVISELRRQ